METSNEQYTDMEIIHKVINGEMKLFEILIRRYNSFLYKIGRAYHFNHQDTEDLMQETYISAYKNLTQFQNRSSFKTWFTRIMLNYCYQKKHKLSFINELTTDDFKNTNSTAMPRPIFSDEKNTTNKELGQIIGNAIHCMPESYRMVFALRELNGLSIAETSECLDISESNVKVRLNRAKSMLRTEIEKIYSKEDIFEFNLVYCDSMVEKVMTEIKRYEESCLSKHATKED
ncbi:MAG: sigma-70 family RNA polymerase sigma factor [Ginsengibacter sp.]